MSHRMDRVQDPVIPQVADWIRENPGTISLGQGVVHYTPPLRSREFVENFWENPKNHNYSPVGGIEPLREMIKEKLKKDNGIHMSALQEVVVTAGANMGFLNALFAITEPGDEVIIFSPYYFNHEMAITMLGCIPVCVPLDESYQLDFELLSSRISPKTKAIVTVSPNNPTGTVFSRDTLINVNRLCGENGIFHISDEAYEYFIYDSVEHFSPGSIADSEGHTISLFSLSKSYGFAGWRIGYMLIPGTLSAAVAKVQDTNLICPALVSQHAALGALEIGAAYPRSYIAGMQEIRDLVSAHLNELGEHCTTITPQGAFYFMLRYNTNRSSLDVVNYLIRNYQVALIPGLAFGMTAGCYLRLAFGAQKRQTVTLAMDRLVEGLKSLGD